ncbi:MAG: hypothetical protein LBK94_04735 [Prevotellaceae bacterium]|jgi:hypothetical protein|nr:hypothetical protein [Prevotellaceae bacterium]
MKNNLKYLLLLTVMCVFTACEKDALDPLSGTYPAPVDYTLDAVIAQNAVKGANTRTFTLELGSSSRYLAVDFVVNRLNYFLTPGTYTIAAEAAARTGNYVAGQTRWVNNGASLPLIDGSIFVKLEGDVYTITGTVMLEDRSIIRIAFTGVIVFEPDPPAFTYTWETQKPYAYTMDGTTFTPVAGSQLNKVTVLSDGIKVAYFEIVTEENRSSLAGAYPVSGMITDVSGAVVRGSYVDLPALGWGTEIIKGGSYLMEDTEQFLFDGNLTIADNAGTLTFTSSNFSILDITSPFYAPIALPGVIKSINYVDATLITGASEYEYSISIDVPATYFDMGTFSNVPIPGSQMNKVAVLKTGDTVAYFEFITAENPGSFAGAYPVMDGPNQIGQMNNGYYIAAMSFGGGSFYTENGDKFLLRAGSTINITDAGGVLGFEGSGLVIADASGTDLSAPGSLNYQNVVPAGSGGGNTTTLTNVLSASALDLASVSGGALTGYTVTLKIGEDGLTAIPNMYGGLDISGTGRYISIDFSRDAATLPAGTYNIVDNTTAVVGDAIAGYVLDLGFMTMNAGSMWVSVNNNVSAETFVISGTVEVAENGGVYTITVNAATDGGETVNAVYTGAITIQ